MVSNKENRSKPKSEGEKHQGVGVNPSKHKENKGTSKDKATASSHEPVRKPTGK